MKEKSDFYVVGIGASAGGLDAVQQVFDNIPDNTGVAFIIIQHLSPDFKSLMPELLAKFTQMKIFTADSDLEIKPNCIYLNQRNKNIGIKGNKFILLDKAPKDHLNLPIDILFHMLGESYKDKSIGVVLSGTGSDGSRGIKTIKEAGGTILVQEPESAQFNGMPNAAISTNLADFVMPPKGIAEKIVQFTGRRLNIEERDETISDNDKTFLSILTEIQKHSGVNFKKYKINTLLRRIEKRMSLLNYETLQDYLVFVKKDEKERQSLSQEFLIGVTSFFRDKEAFDFMRNHVVPSICNKKNKQDSIRVWVPGCSSGEEVYSLAILFEDYIRLNKLGIDYKIYATDLDKKALRQASSGNYPVNICAEIDKPYLEEYFLKTGDKIQIVKKIRDKIVFSYHDVTVDPPFIRLDLISCRNLLIYFSNTTQKTVLSGFQFALHKDGFLFLGSSESLGNLSSLFKSMEPKYKIFQNLHDNKRVFENQNSQEPPHRIGYTDNYRAMHFPSMDNERKKKNEEYFYRYLSKKHSPVSVFVDSEYNVQFILGNFKKWFCHTEGAFSNNLLQMVHPELAVLIRNGLRRLTKKDTGISVKNIVIQSDEESLTTDLLFERMNDSSFPEKVFLVQFSLSSPEDTSEKIVLSNEDVSNMSKQRIEDLEYELKEKRSELQSVIEELETSNEELQSANEELMSSNEELQSSNEELQSVNEELYTVNTEFQEKNRELENLNNDINNLLNSSDIGTLFLDVELNIRKFTPAIKRLFKLEDSDIGRSIGSFASVFDEETRRGIIKDSNVALEKLQTFEKEVHDHSMNWYLKRISPFVTSDKKIEGVVVTFVEISNLIKVKHQLSEIESRLTSALEAGNMAWWEMKIPSGEVFFSRNKARMIGQNPEDFYHYRDFMKYVHPDDYKPTMQAMQNYLDGKADVYACEYRIKSFDGSYKWFQDIGKVVHHVGDQKVISGVVLDITVKKEIELNLVQTMKKVETANIYKNQFLANMSHELRTPMNGLVGFASLLRDDHLPSETKKNYIDLIESSSKQLLNLINDIIDVSKIEAGELNVSIEPCVIDKLLTELEETFNELKHHKSKNHLEIKALLPKSITKLQIKTDPHRLKQILSNLIGNALKFTDKGKITFGYTLINKKLVFKVSDTGIGMSKDKLDLIFERFQQLVQDDPANYEGTGLGLAISKGLIGLLGGTISANSTLGKGSVFTFDIPYMPIEEDKFLPGSNSAINPEFYRGKQILVAEDDYTNKLYIEELLKDLPMHIYWANNGLEAVELFKSNPSISLVLMDIRMPKMDGYQAALKMFEHRPSIRVIAQTAYAMSSDREKCLKSGFVDYVSKPLQKEKLIELITRWLE